MTIKATQGMAEAEKNTCIGNKITVLLLWTNQVGSLRQSLTAAGGSRLSFTRIKRVKKRHLSRYHDALTGESLKTAREQQHKGSIANAVILIKSLIWL